MPKTDERREGDSSLNQSVTDKNFVFVREVDTTLSMLGFRVRAPEGGGRKAVERYCNKQKKPWLNLS